jgi:serine/threonine protein kinase
MDNQPNQEETIFHAAIELAPAERNAYLTRACAGDEPLRRRIEVLLQAEEEADPFFGKEPLDVALGTQAGAQTRTGERPRTVIGHYRLLEKLGEGGFGVVYMAEQKEPVKRKVALKIIKVGMDTREVVARFEAERQALALMDHPNIAKVLDAGATQAPLPGSVPIQIGTVSPISNRQTPDNAPAHESVETPQAGSAAIQSRFGSGRYEVSAGRPYFVMELVRGTRITDYCDEKSLSTRDRLDLFMKVCSAVQHAHQKGIIHRDLKPSNILVTVNDGAAVPKIIDFGIAKATQMELTEKTVFTRFQQFLGTPAYMSPEQAELTSVDIDCHR